ncbi:MAG TPA: molecular chaperone HtpG [Salinivirgaceae bacterium]|nr:molecular chaperone HtpG [Salinivirgaceae bacterium]
MQTGKINVTSENIFPIIKKFLYSDHEIFLRELISNAVDATQKIKTLARKDEFKEELGDLTIRVKIDKDKKTITISDRGIGMTADEVNRYINEIAFSSANEFLEKYKADATSIIGHFGLGFYSAFMVSKKVEIFTKSYKSDAKAVHWSCEGTPEYVLEEIDTKNDRGTDIVLTIDDENQNFLEKHEIEKLLKKYCRFLPIPIAFGKIEEWKDGKYVETDKDNIINITEPAWTKSPSDLKEDDYMEFYRTLYPIAEDPLFYIHLNVDYPFNLTGILYFPKIKSNLDIQRNKIQLYCNQVFVTDSVEGIVPEFLTLLHGVIDSPDIPLNVSRSYLQSDANVKKISAHITKKVADRLQEIFKNDRTQFEQKWDNLKLFIQYGILTDDKFEERAKSFLLLKNIDDKYFTLDEYETLVKPNQTDKYNKVIYLYATNKIDQHSYIAEAKEKGYDILLLDGYLDMHFINKLENSLKDIRFVRVDADVIEKLIEKDQTRESKLTSEQKELLTPVFRSQLPEGEDFYLISFESLDENQLPIKITQKEFMRRMKDMSSMSGMNYYANLPNSYDLVVNSNHPLIVDLAQKVESEYGVAINELNQKIETKQKELDAFREKHSDKEDEENLPEAEKEKQRQLESEIEQLKKAKDEKLGEFANNEKRVKQIIDLALLANNMLKGESLSMFVKRSVEIMR